MAALGEYHTFLRDSFGRVWTCGKNNNEKKLREIENLVGVEKIATFVSTALLIAIDTNGDVWGYGESSVVKEFKEGLLKIPKLLSKSASFAKVACGDTHAVCVTAHGSLWGFGNNSKGQLGPKHTGSSFESLEPLDIEDVHLISCGGDRTIVRLFSGIILATGSNEHKIISTQKGTVSEFTEIATELTTPVVSIASGRGHTLFLDENGDVYGVGRNDFFQNGCPEMGNVNFHKVNGLPRILKISCGSNHSMCIDEEGYFWTFGCNFEGRLGTCCEKHGSVPTRIDCLGGNIMSISQGGLHTFVKDENGDVWAFGTGESGQLGFVKERKKHYPKKLDSAYSHFMAEDNQHRFAKSARK